MKETPSSSSVAAAEVVTSNPELTKSSNSFAVFANTINGKPCLNGKKTQAINPSTRRPLWDVPVATDDDIETAVTAAKEAFETWSQTSWNERAKYLNKAKGALMEIRDDMADLIMQEDGKPVGTVEGEFTSDTNF
jgi:acyl-CoA reductase-like NAD-dependent aldehyde dehydrogenase